MVFIYTVKISTGKNGVSDITAQIAGRILESGIRNGIAVVETGERAAGIIRTNADSPEIRQDILNEMRKLVPARINYKNEESPEDAAGCIKSALFGSSVSLIISDAKLKPGTGIYYLDYDGPAEREYSICIYGEQEK